MVLVLHAESSEALWVLPGQHLVLDECRAPRWRAYGPEEFATWFTSLLPAQVFDDGEVA